MDVTLAQVAERAGVGKATVYRTYASREDMVAAMLTDRLAWLRERTEAALAGPDPWAAFAAMTRDVLQQMREDHLLRFALSPGRPLSELGQLGERMSSTLGPPFTSLLTAVKATGRIRQDITESDIAILISG